MKKRTKVTITTILIVLLLASLITCGFALYTITLNNHATGSVDAKHFVLTGNGTSSFTSDITKIAPGETVNATFTIANFEGTKITETAMDVDIIVTLTSTIAPLTIALYEGDVATGTNVLVATTDASSTVETTFSAGVSTTKTYTVVISWPSTANDVAYESGTASYSITVTGVQA